MPTAHSAPALYVAFGLPGAGKTYAAYVFERFGFTVHDGDDDLPPDMRAAIEAAQAVTDAMRDAFFDRIIAHTAELWPRHPRLVVAQTFIKEQYRLRFLEAFPAARFVLVRATDDLRERRLSARPIMRLDPTYARRMVTLFEPPRIPHHLIDNNADGDAHLERQIAELLVSVKE
jgi:gluconate kinase